MTETVRDVHRRAVLAALEEFWQNPQRDRITHRVPERIAGSPADQVMPEGTENPYWEIIRQTPCDTIGSPWRHARPQPDPYFTDPATNRYLADRKTLCMAYSWSIPSPGDIAWITSRLSSAGVVEPGAGGGYWAWQLAQAGVDVIAYDPADPAGSKFTSGEPWYPVLRDDHGVTARHPDRSLLLCWPSYDEPWGAWSLAAYKGTQVFYIGEGQGGCCATDEFFDLLEAEWEEAGISPHHVTYSGIHCSLTEYRRKARP